MPNFGKIILTNAGINALVKAQAGNVLTFTKIKMGSGMLSGGIEELTDLVEVQLSADIINGTITDQTYTVEANFTNEGLKTGFYWREIGLYVKDGSGKDALFGYANAGTSSDYIPATESEIYTKHVRIAVAVGAIENITVQNSGGAYVDTITFNESLGKKVDKEEGKGLSKNDFSDEYKSKLDGIVEGANKYVLPTATLSTLGGIKSGGAVTVNKDGTTTLNAHKHDIGDINNFSTNAVTGIKGSSESTYRKGDVSLTKANIGLENVDNTSDKNKPISDATQKAIDDLSLLITNAQNAINALSQNVSDNYVTQSDLDDYDTYILRELSNKENELLRKIGQNNDSIDAINNKIGTANISTIGDGTLKGAILKLYEMIQAVPTISSGTSEPSGGVDGDVYIMHE